MGSASGNGGAVKVVIINTQYVETDALSFKSVVQKLTGKDATVEAHVRRPRPRSGNEVKSRPPVLERVISFKDFDRMLKDLPPLDELYKLYADDIY